MVPDGAWVNADIDCCDFASALKASNVRVFQFELAMTLLQHMIAKAKAKAGSREAMKAIELALKSGLLLVSIGLVFEMMGLLPKSRAFQSVANDYRNRAAVKTVLGEQTQDFVTIYGTAHGPGLLGLLGAAGFRESDGNGLRCSRSKRAAA